ncbi:MAG: phosphoribosylanthranilate isomerase [Anaerolineae bacterium]|nr:phosphoribosylanthranilate isomerase [Anaerolineae bacterium]
MTQVKICGLTNIEDVQVAVDEGVEFLGFILYEKSPRYVTTARVARIMSFLRGYDVPRIPVCIGVFVNPSVDEVEQALAHTGLQAAQVHKATPDVIREMRTRTLGSLYPAVQPRTASEIVPYTALDDEAGVYPTAFYLPQLMVDAYHPDLAGGTGKQADLELAAEIAASVPRLMLAGGLTADNVATTIRAAQPWAVDVSSGVEASPGKKDHEKVRAFIRAVRAVDKEIAL